LQALVLSDRENELQAPGIGATSCAADTAKSPGSRQRTSCI